MNKQEIILKYIRDKKSKREISRETGFARKTIDKYISEYEEKLRELHIDPNDEIERQQLISEITGKPKYKSSSRTKYVLTDDILEKIQFYLNENKEKRLTGRSKQQKKKKDIFEALVEDGYKVSYSSVLRAINNIERPIHEAYIKQQYQPGDVVEFDWGTVKIYTDDGVLREYQMAVFTAAFSNFRWAKLFPKQNTQCFIEAHSDFFEDVSGSFATVVYDNMRTAVRKFISHSEKEPTEDLLKLSLYYRFNFRFCNARSGNEKGHVERSVEVIRRKAFSGKDCFASLDEANEHLVSACTILNNIKSSTKKKNPMELFQVEQENLLKTLGKYETAKVEMLRVDKFSTIIVESCHYSVPDIFVNKILKCKIYSNDIIVYFDNEKVTHHKKNPGFNQWILDIKHYFTTLSRKPNALPNSVAFEQLDLTIKDLYMKYFVKKEKDFIELITLIGDIGIEKVKECIIAIESVTPADVTIDKIKFIAQRNSEDLCLNLLESDSMIVHNSIDILKGYAKMLFDRKDDVFNER